MQVKNLPDVSVLILSVWLVAATLYIIGSFAYPYIATQSMQSAYNEGRAQGQKETYDAAMQTFSGNVLQNGYTKAVLDLGNALQAQVKGGCQQAVPVTIGSGTTLGVVSVDCLNTGSGKSSTK